MIVNCGTEKRKSFMDLRQLNDNKLQEEQKKRNWKQTKLSSCHIYQSSEGADGTKYAVPELYRSVGIEELKIMGASYQVI